MSSESRGGEASDGGQDLVCGFGPVEGFGLAVMGLLIGAAIALLLARLLSSFSRLLYGVRTSDPLTFMTTSLVLVGVSVLASFLPAHRASRIDPMTALKYE